MQLVPVTCWLLQRKSTERYIANCAKIPGALGRQSLYLFCHAQDTMFKDNPRHDSGIQKSIAFLRPVNANRNGTVLLDHWWLHSELLLGKFPYVSSFSQTNKTSCYRCRAHLLGYQGVFWMVRGNDEAKSLDPGKRRNMWARLDDSNIFKYKKRRFICPFEVPKTCCNCERRSK